MQTLPFLFSRNRSGRCAAAPSNLNCSSIAPINRVSRLASPSALYFSASPSMRGNTLVIRKSSHTACSAASSLDWKHTTASSSSFSARYASSNGESFSTPLIAPNWAAAECRPRQNIATIRHAAPLFRFARAVLPDRRRPVAESQWSLNFRLRKYVVGGMPKIRHEEQIFLAMQLACRHRQAMTSQKTDPLWILVYERP